MMASRTAMSSTCSTQTTRGSVVFILSLLPPAALPAQPASWCFLPRWDRPCFNVYLSTWRDFCFICPFVQRTVSCKAQVEEIAKALDGTYRDEHLFALGQAVESWKFYQKQIDDVDE